MKIFIVIILFFQNHSLFYNINYLNNLINIGVSYNNYTYISGEDEKKQQILLIQEALMKLSANLNTNNTLTNLDYLRIVMSLKRINNYFNRLVDNKVIQVTTLLTNNKLLDIILTYLHKNNTDNIMNNKFIKNSCINIILNLSDELEVILETFDLNNIRINYLMNMKLEVNNLAYYSFY